MALTFLGKDPDSPINDSPTIYDNGDTYVIQGWRIAVLARIADGLGIPRGHMGLAYDQSSASLIDATAG